MVLRAHNAYGEKSPDSSPQPAPAPQGRVHPGMGRCCFLTLPKPQPGDRPTNPPALLLDEPKSALTCRCFRKSRAICTFCSRWKRIRPFSRGCKKKVAASGQARGAGPAAPCMHSHPLHAPGGRPWRPPRLGCAGGTPPCTPHTLIYLLAPEENKVIAMHDPAEIGQKAHGGARGWEDPEIPTSSECQESPRVCTQAPSRALHGCRQLAGLAQPLDPREGSHPSHGQPDKLGRGLSKERFARAGTESDLARWKQSRSAPQQDTGTQAATACGSPLVAEKPRPQHQPPQTRLGSSARGQGLLLQVPSPNPRRGEK